MKYYQILSKNILKINKIFTLKKLKFTNKNEITRFNQRH